MRVHDLVNHPLQQSYDFRAHTSTGSRETAMAPTPTASGTFITPQSLVSFPFAAGLVAAFWKGAQRLLPAWAEAPWIALVIALAVGALIYLISVSDDRLHLSRRQKIVALGIAAINCFYLFLSALELGSK